MLVCVPFVAIFRKPVKSTQHGQGNEILQPDTHK